ncbi:hypothetical protein Syun_000104 [Stephania yunnanensis]|uniref:RING-type E3 ubiquitin transferase n=1 Tax=Stephania yunnanensis TaxID=152371 RepID=A0AAP0Q6H2_9MAGN
MAVSPRLFPPRKRRPSTGSFASPPNSSDLKLVRSLLHLSREISDLKPLDFALKRCSSSIIRKTKILVVLFEEIINGAIHCLPRTATLCFEEIHIVLQRIKTLLEDCSNGSKIWILMQNESFSNSFHELTVDLSTLLDIFPLEDFVLVDDVKELVELIRKQCWEKKAFVDPTDTDLRFEVTKLLEQFKSEIVPDRSNLENLFEKLRLRDSKSCRDEIERLEDEIRNQVSEKSTAEIVALIGLVRYAKCVLFGASTPRRLSRIDSKPSRDDQFHISSSDLVFPADFRCPISLDLMRDPVVAATGQTYDRSSIGLWIESGHNTCPKTGQTLAHTDLIPNLALKNLISLWCRDQKVHPFEPTEINCRCNCSSSSTTNKAALEAARMTALFLVNNLSISPPIETANRLIYELRLLAKSDSSNRSCIAEAGAIPHLARYLTNSAEEPNLQINAVTTILNLSIFDSNKSKIMESFEALDGVIEVLRSGATWEAKANAAATLFSLTAVGEYRKILARKRRVLEGLVELGRAGPVSAKKDALVAILNLAGEKEAIGRLLEAGVVNMTVEAGEELPEEAVAILATVAKRGGVMAVAATPKAVAIMAGVLRDGPQRARESATAGLVSVCRRSAPEVVGGVAMTAGIERAMWELMANGTPRARRKSASLMRILRRWAAGVEDRTVAIQRNDDNVVSTSTLTVVHQEIRLLPLFF